MRKPFGKIESGEPSISKEKGEGEPEKEDEKKDEKKVSSGISQTELGRREEEEKREKEERREECEKMWDNRYMQIRKQTGCLDITGAKQERLLRILDNGYGYGKRKYPFRDDIDWYKISKTNARRIAEEDAVIVGEE